MCSDWTSFSLRCWESCNCFLTVRVQLRNQEWHGIQLTAAKDEAFSIHIASSKKLDLQTEERATYVTFFQHSHPDVLFLWTTLLLQRTLKTCIKQGANKSNYGRLVGKEGTGVSRSGVVSPHIRLRAQKSLQENPQRFMGLIMMHSTQGMFNCGRFFFLLFSFQLCFLAYTMRGYAF